MTAPEAVTPRASGGALLVLVGTVVSGIAGYGTTVIAFRDLGAAEYSLFAVFWAFLYLAVGGLSGIQQEFARATRTRSTTTQHRAGSARNFAAASAAALFALIVATSPLWDDAVFVRDGWQLTIALAMGAASYVVVATLAGSLYGVSQWRSIFLLIVTDGVLRLVLVAIALAFTRDLVAIAWAVVIPFPAAIVLLWWFVRRGIVNKTRLDVGYRALGSNVGRTITASASTAVMVSGFPLILGVAGKSSSAHYVGELIFAITIARAPLIVAVGSLQSIFVVRFRDASQSFWRPLGFILGLLVVGGGVLAVLALYVGPLVLAWFEGHSSAVSGPLIGGLVASSGLIAALTVSGSAALAQSRHLIYTLGWVLAAIATIAIMAIPVALAERVALALTIAPVVGLAFHLVALARVRRTAARIQ